MYDRTLTPAELDAPIELDPTLTAPLPVDDTPLELPGLSSEEWDRLNAEYQQQQG